jgi:Right handed beta helix region
MSTKEIARKSRSDSGRAGGPPLLARKSVLMGVLASGFVIANTAHPSSATAATQTPTVPAWQPATPYVLGQQVISPNCDVVKAKAAHTSSSAYATDTAMWVLGCTDARRDAVGMFAKDNGVVGDGIADDGAALNALLSTAATLGIPVVLAPLSTVFTTVGIVIPSNTRLNGNRATIKCGIAGLYTPTVGIANASNVLIENLVIDGNKAAFGATTEWKHGVGMRAATNVILRNVTSNTNKGDGVYLAGAVAGSYSERITLDNVTCEHNHRNGLSLISAKTVRVLGGSYSYTSGTFPKCGIDIEPNYDNDVIQDVSFDGIVAKGNDESGLLVVLRDTPTVPQEGIQATACNFSGNTRAGVDLYKAYHVGLTDCAINDNVSSGITSDVTIKHLTVRGGTIMRNGNRGIYAWGKIMTDWLVSGVKILDNVGYGISLNYDAGGTTSGFVIESNTIGNDTTTHQQYGILVGGAAFTNVSILNNDVRSNTANGLVLSDDAATRITRGNRGYNPRGPVGPPARPASGGTAAAIPNPYGADCMVYISGGSGVNVILGTSALGWVTTGVSTGVIRVLAGMSISLGSYSVAPTWTWFAE